MVRPTKLAIRGVETGTPLYHAVAQKFGGHLKQFHGKQQQMYALSDNPIARGHIDWGDARATYTNIAGQEILELEVDARVLSELQGQPKQSVPDYAVVDLIVPNSQDMWCEFTAALMTPDIGREVIAGAIKGVEEDFGWGVQDYSWGWPNPVIEYADAMDRTTTVPISNRVASLKVDFRGMPDDAMVVVKLFGEMFPNESDDDQHGQQVGISKFLEFGIGTLPSTTTPSGNLTDPACITASYEVDSYSGIVGSTPGDLYVFQGVEYLTFATFHDTVLAPFQTTTLATPYIDYYRPFLGTQYGDTFQTIWGYLNHGVELHLDYSDANVGPYGARGYFTHFHYSFNTYANHIHQELRPIYEDEANGVAHAVRQCDLTYAYYEPGQQFFVDLAGEYFDPEDVGIWVTEEGQLPQRSKFAEVRMDSTDVGASSDDNPVGYPYLGDLIFARRDRAVSFKPA
jgi:hypothetical protein